MPRGQPADPLGVDAMATLLGQLGHALAGAAHQLFLDAQRTNASIARELTAAPPGSREWRSTMRQVQRWRSHFVGGTGQRRAPRRAQLARLAQLGGGTVHVSGTVVLTYNGISQGTRQLDETIDLAHLEGRASDPAASVQAAIDQYIGVPGQYYAGDESVLGIWSEGKD